MEPLHGVEIHDVLNHSISKLDTLKNFVGEKDYGLYLLLDSICEDLRHVKFSLLEDNPL